MSLQLNVRQTRSQTRAQQENASLNKGNDGRSKSLDNSFIPSIFGENEGELHNCGGFEREISGAIETTPSLVSELSSTSSQSKARLDRELQRLEEEKKLLDDLNRERIERERALNEKELLEKLERGKEFIARKHELLSQHDDEERRSDRSMRNSQRSTKRTEDWVRQSGSGGKDTEQIPASASAIPGHLEQASLVIAQGVHPSSTPLKIGPELPSSGGKSKVNKGSEVKSIPKTLESITIGDSEDSVDGAVGMNVKKYDPSQNSSNVPFVDLQPYEDILKLDEIPTSESIPKINRFGGHCYKRWSAETEELRKQNTLLLQQQTEANRQAVQEMMLKHCMDTNTRRKREMELVDRISWLEEQHAGELRKAHKSVEDLRIQLERHDHEKTVLITKIKTLELQLVDEKNRTRNIEAALQDQLTQRDRKCKSLQHQFTDLDRKFQCLRGTEQQLLSQIKVAHQREQKATRMREEAEKEYWDLHNEVEQIIERNIDVDSESSFSLPPPPAAWLEPENVLNQNASNPLASFHLPISQNTGSPVYRQEAKVKLGTSDEAINQSSTISSAANVPNCMPRIHSQPLMPLYSGCYLGPSPQQLAARQVVTKELPHFSGDPTDWPLFISSYQHSTETCGYTNSENLLRLQRCLRGNAKDAVSSFLLHPSTVPQVLSTLQQLYGRPEQIVNNMIAKVRATPPPKPDRLESLVSFGLVVQNLCGHLKAVGLQRYLTNPILLQELVDKLPTTVKFNWALYQQQFPMADLNVFCDYMTKVSSAASGISLPSNPQISVKDERFRSKERSFLNIHGNNEQQKGRETGTSNVNEGRCPICNANTHQTVDCDAFNELDLDGKWEAVKMNKVCACCLTSHMRWPCKGDICGINGCSERHHRSLHFEPLV